MNTIKSEIEVWIKKQGLTLISESKLLSSNIYNSIPSLDRSNNRYSLPPYKTINFPSKNTMKELSIDLDTDALILLQIYFKKETYRDSLQIPLTPDNFKLFCMCLVTVIGKNGELIFEKEFSGLSPKTVSSQSSYVQFTLYNKPLKKLIDMSSANLVSTIKDYISN